MEWSDSERRVYKQIVDWEQGLFEYIPTDIERALDKWIEFGFEKLDPEIKEQFFKNLDNMLFHLHAFIQGSDSQMIAKERLIKTARVLDEDIDQVTDLKKLTIDQLVYLADQQIAKYRIYSFAQGGLAGTGGALLGVDVPAVVMLNLRAVQTLANVYGYDVNIPYEMMTSLRVFHAATLPKRMRAAGWSKLINEVQQFDDQFYYLYEKDEELTNETWLEQPLIQILKSMVIILFRKKVIQGLPLVSMAFGAGMNYKLSRQVTEFANHFYQMRYLNEKNNVEI
ncbi:EcsC protein family [Schinkia azotoformans MEV2011]|uniref:EcsC protein family n=1 Tax=Schinkia azotoformans MEV2011 TaxID=1348973 RepID=A0A072NRV3_SCHAZ|nr:EcsC family protein [Schinkia azotoformans]KEF39593.1 EcsC protein family [Schinkia azotoformans MEV2011]MEC1694283.1 EcsC family protein [Schinkia azotoformans]MEC1714916.1 EcsC family protein [Schinkia azotoformans]MEC1723503.1 EcsC family protein [Schinkia azotoformans]MEC1742853.1 EcsC family protein [Schinkia azotoformans]